MALMWIAERSVTHQDAALSKPTTQSVSEYVEALSLLVPSTDVLALTRSWKSGLCFCFWCLAKSVGYGFWGLLLYYLMANRPTICCEPTEFFIVTDRGDR